MISDGNLSKSCGIEYISNLLDRGVRRMTRWDNEIKKNFPQETRKIEFGWQNEDFTKSSIWYDSTFILLHWTAFSKDQIAKVSEVLRACREGTVVITLTHQIETGTDDYLLLVKDKCITSWGPADFFVFEKKTPPQTVLVR